MNLFSIYVKVLLDPYLQVLTHFTANGASQVALVVTNLPANAGDVGDRSSVLRSVRFPGGGNDNPLRHS